MRTWTLLFVASFTNGSNHTSLIQIGGMLPGNTLKRDADQIVKHFGQTKKSRRHAHHHYTSEKRALQRLAEYNDVCSDGLKHFPSLLSYDDKEMRLSMSYQGQVVVNQNSKQFSNHQGCHTSMHAWLVLPTA